MSASIDIWNDMIRQGVDRGAIYEQAKRHVEALLDLKDSEDVRRELNAVRGYKRKLLREIQHEERQRTVEALKRR